MEPRIKRKGLVVLRSRKVVGVIGLCAGFLVGVSVIKSVAIVRFYDNIKGLSVNRPSSRNDPEVRIHIKGKSEDLTRIERKRP